MALMSAKAQSCRDCSREFTITPDELSMYESLRMPPRRQCFKCLMRQRLAFWVYGKFRKGRSDLSGDPLITTLPAKTRYPVYTSKEWFSDAWDGMDYGRDYDPSRPFFDQVKELQEKVPRPHQLGENNVACDWCDDVWESKDCYLSKSLTHSQNADYGYRMVRIKDSMDLTYCFDTERSYDSTYCFKCFRIQYCFDCRDSLNSMFLYDCRNVQDCFMCCNLRGKQYYIRNHPYSKEDYFRELAKYNFGSREAVRGLRSEYEAMVRQKAVHRENFNVKTEKSEGNYLTNCFNCQVCFHWEDSRDCYNCMRGFANKGLIDATGTWGLETGGNLADCFGGYNVKHSVEAMHCRDSEYLDHCVDCGNCFGCVGLKKKNYCILNQQYSEEDYKKLRGEIVAGMEKEGAYGDFFPYSMTYCGYNLSNAQNYFPDSKENIEKLGGYFDDVADPVQDGISPQELPDDIRDVPDSITTQPLNCPRSRYRFNIAPRELAFYRAMNIPLPYYHFDIRNLDRFKLISVIDAYPYHCTFCGKDIQAYYPPEWGYEKIACVECYQREII